MSRPKSIISRLKDIFSPTHRVTIVSSDAHIDMETKIKEKIEVLKELITQAVESKTVKESFPLRDIEINGQTVTAIAANEIIIAHFDDLMTRLLKEEKEETDIILKNIQHALIKHLLTLMGKVNLTQLVFLVTKIFELPTIGSAEQIMERLLEELPYSNCATDAIAQEILSSRIEELFSDSDPTDKPLARSLLFEDDDITPPTATSDAASRPASERTAEIEESISAEEDINRKNLRSGEYLFKKDFETIKDGKALVTVEDIQFQNGAKYYNNMFFALHFIENIDRQRIFENSAEVFSNSFNNCAFTNIQFNPLKATKFINCTFTNCDFPHGFGGEFQGKCIFKNIDFSAIEPRVLKTIKFSADCTFSDCIWPEGHSAADMVTPPKPPIPRPYIKDQGTIPALDRIQIPTL